MVFPKDTARSGIAQWLLHGQYIHISLVMGCPQQQAVELLVTRRENFAGGGGGGRDASEWKGPQRRPQRR